ncbi:hypothetical protein ABK040_007137 [Willaertia magna]
MSHYRKQFNEQQNSNSSGSSSNEGEEVSSRPSHHYSASNARTKISVPQPLLLKQQQQVSHVLEPKISVEPAMDTSIFLKLNNPFNIIKQSDSTSKARTVGGGIQTIVVKPALIDSGTTNNNSTAITTPSFCLIPLENQGSTINNNKHSNNNLWPEKVTNNINNTNQGGISVHLSPNLIPSNFKDKKEANNNGGLENPSPKLSSESSTIRIGNHTTLTPLVVEANNHKRSSMSSSTKQNTEFQPEKPIILDLSRLPSTFDSTTSENFTVEKPKKKVKGFVNDGPWEPREHDAFMRGYKECGANWKIIADNYVKTRTRIQVASYAVKVLKNVNID